MPKAAVRDPGRCRSANLPRHRRQFAVGDSSAIAFDTFGTPGRARAYRNAIEAVVPDKPISTIIYSHDHLDIAG